jgi:hypothetical protein
MQFATQFTDDELAEMEEDGDEEDGAAEDAVAGAEPDHDEIAELEP